MEWRTPSWNKFRVKQDSSQIILPYQTVRYFTSSSQIKAIVYVPFSTNTVSVRLKSSLVFYILGAFFNTTIVPLALVGYLMVTWVTCHICYVSSGRIGPLDGYIMSTFSYPTHASGKIWLNVLAILRITVNLISYSWQKSSKLKAIVCFKQPLVLNS